MMVPHGGPSHRIAGGQAGHDRRGVESAGRERSTRCTAGVDVSSSHTKRWVGWSSFGPERDLVGCRCDGARHQRHLEAGGDLDGLRVVGPVVGPSALFVERMPEAEELFGVRRSAAAATNAPKSTCGLLARVREAAPATIRPAMRIELRVNDARIEQFLLNCRGRKRQAAIVADGGDSDATLASISRSHDRTCHLFGIAPQ